MANLIHRTEEALLGALIYDPSLAGDVPYLLPRHFADIDHQAIFAAFLDVRAGEPGIWGATMAERIAVQVDLPSVTETRLAGMAIAGPDVSSVAVYGRMIQEAGLYRELGAHAARLAQAAGTVRGVDPELDHLDTLAAALRTHNAGFHASFEATLTHQVAVEAPQHDLRALREEQVLADLIQHPEYLGEVVAWLDPEVFTTDDRRHIYAAIVAVDTYGEPVEELTLAWELARTRAAVLSGDGETTEVSHTPGYVARLATVTVEAGVAIEIGRDLLAEHVRAEITTSAAQLGQSGDARTIEVTAQRSLDREHTITHAEPAPLLIPPDRTLGLDGPQLRQ